MSPMELYNPYYGQATAVTATTQMLAVLSMSSLDVLLSKLPSVNPTAAGGM